MSATEDKKISQHDLQFLHAYLECSDKIQEGIREMMAIVFDRSVDADDRQMAIATLADALYPHLYEGKLGLDAVEAEQMGSQHSEETREVFEDMDREECVFADRLSAIMSDREISQVQLAKMSGVGQPAISNMLLRQCRPQRRTVLRFAEALGIDPSELWPDFSAQ